MDYKKQAALDIVLQSGYLDVISDNEGYPKGMLRKVAKPVMQMVITANYAYFAYIRRRFGFMVWFNPDRFR